MPGPSFPHRRLNRTFRLLLPALLFLCAFLAHAWRGHPAAELAYIGPGAGFAFLGSFLTVVLSVILSVLSVLAWPFRMLWLAIRRQGRFGNASVKKAILLGLDGLDPGLTEKWMAEGKLPNLARLREQGSYSRLRTTFPALSPVAWSTFATGVNPARHNIFDFLNRDMRTYAPELSSARVTPPTRFLRIGKWSLPLNRSTVELRRKSEPFWKILGKHAINSTILRVPVTFPPEPFRGRLLSAMSTPDLRGTQGTFSWFSTSPDEPAVEGGVRLRLTAQGDTVRGALPGPDNSKLEFSVRVRDRESVTIAIQDHEYTAHVGQYTPWIRLRFPSRGMGTVRGIVRLLVTSVAPHLSLYATPVEIDPENPALPISYPSYYAVYLAKLLGTFATLGMAEDTWALNEGAIDEGSFLAQAKLIQAEREAMFFSALERTKRGAVACVFDTSDRVQHMFYRHLEPAHHAPADVRYAGVIEELYRDMDRIVGKTLKYVDRRTALFVLSDHGFCSFRRGVNLNAWLHHHGYLALRHGATEGGDYFAGIDWSRTRAYTFGLSGVYLNLEGRESQGIVTASEAPRLREELKSRLTGLSDDADGEVAAIREVYDAHAIYNGPYLDAAPDLVIGYEAGYRASWSAAVGKVSRAVFEDNTKCWSGDHCVDPTLVPGVLFSNLKLEANDPGIEDMAPTVLKLFGIGPPQWMEGKSLLAN